MIGMGMGLRMGSRGGGFTPASLFAGGEDGFLLQRRNGGFFQEPAASTAAGNGDPVGYAPDRSGAGTSATQSTASFKPILQATGLDHDGVDDRILTDYNPTLSGSLAARFNGDAANVVVVGSAAAANGRCYFGLDGSGRLGAGIGAQTSATIFAGSDLRNAWHTGIVTWNGTTVKMYLDGDEVYSAAQSGAVNTTVAMTVGAFANNGTPAAFWSNLISDALAINRVLTATEAANLDSYWS